MQIQWCVCRAQELTNLDKDSATSAGRGVTLEVLRADRRRLTEERVEEGYLGEERRGKEDLTCSGKRIQSGQVERDVAPHRAWCARESVQQRDC